MLSLETIENKMNTLEKFFTSRPSHIPLLEYRYYSLLRVVHSLAFLCHLSFLLLFYFLDVYELIYIQFLSLSVFAICIYLNEKRHYIVSAIIGTLEVIVHQALCVFMIGIESQFHLFLALSAMIPFLLPKGQNIVKSTLLSLSVGGIIFIQYVIGINEPIYTINPTILTSIGATNILITGLFLGVFGMYFAKAISITERQLELERAKSDKLLYNILPLSIANRLKKEDQVIAEEFEAVSVLFADIVGFTKLSERLSPEELVINLNEIFSNFDELVDKYDLEKIKTIGDAYMVSSGLPEPDPSEAKKMAAFALEMKAYMENRMESSNEKLQIRIGINSGPVIAGVIGKKKFAYDLWGDTVNIANRMESHGDPGKIHISESFKKLIENEYEIEKRMPITVKGKGEMQTYFLIKSFNT